jgi:hypothetical protein
MTFAALTLATLALVGSWLWGRECGRQAVIASLKPRVVSWVNDFNVTRIVDALDEVIADRDQLLADAEQYPVEVTIEGWRFVFCDEADFDAMVAKVREKLDEHRRAA